MLFTCAPRASAATRPASRKVVKRGNKSLAVDFHCHAHTPAADELAKKTDAPAADPLARYGNPRTQDHQQKLRAQLDRKLTSIEQRLADMDKMGIDVQAISTSPMQYYYGLDPVARPPDLARDQRTAGGDSGGLDQPRTARSGIHAQGV